MDPRPGHPGAEDRPRIVGLTAMALFDKTVKKTKYPNGDVRIEKKSGAVYEFNKIRPDGKRERDGK